MKTLYKFACLFLLCGCGYNNINYQIHQSDTVIDSSECINISTSIDNFSTLLDSITEQIRIIQLETNVNTIVSEIDQIITTSDYIYILDHHKNGSVVIFTIDGTFVKRIPVGAGPNEIARAQRIYHCAADSILYVHDEGSRKIKKFTNQGDYIGYDDDIVIFSDFAVYNGNYVLVSPSMQSPHQKFSVSVGDSTICDYWILGDDYKYESTLGYIPYLREGEESILIMKPRGNKVYCYDGEKFYIKYELKTNKDFDYSNCKSIGLIKDNLSSGDFIFANDFIESNDYQLIRVYEKGINNFDFVFRYKNPEKIWAEATSKTLNSDLLRHYVGVHNYYENVFCSYILPEQFMSESISNHYRWAGSNPNNLISDADMEKLKAVTPDDNPIIVLFKLKDDI